jgi:NAD(P)-dependent dehydrogenase (short-subunit alcohol dehydrogenase family)
MRSGSRSDPLGIDAVVIEPGFIRTSLAEAAVNSMEPVAEREAPYGLPSPELSQPEDAQRGRGAGREVGLPDPPGS